jgi:hypothetical protein
MPLVPLQIPPGFYRNGTDLQGAGRWRDGSLVRWREGSLRPVGGWAERVASAFADPVRGMHAWEANNGDRWLAGGTYDALKAVTSGGLIYDITPAGFTAGNVDAVVNTGYGGAFYGTGFYGQTRQNLGSYGEATTWTLDNWGEYLVACSYDDGKLYEWQLGTGTPAAVIANAPTNNLGLMVTEERFIFALGSDGDPRRIDWCDQEDNTTWTPASTNQAGSQVLQTVGQCMAAVRTTGQTLVLTDIDAHRAVYVGPPFVYQFERVGTACGLIARKAVASTDAGVFWMGANGFFVFDGSSVRELPCEVHDYIFNDINPAQISKSWAVSNGQNAEIWWFYPSANSTEVNSYVAYDYQEGHWLIGKLNRTSGVDRGVFRAPIWADETGDLYDHETGFNFGTSDVFAESGPANFGDGEFTFNAKKLIPDELTQGDVELTFKTRLYPNGTETSHGPYSMTNPTSVRFSGRQARMRVDAVRPTNWRFGIPRLEVSQAGKR